MLTQTRIWLYANSSQWTSNSLTSHVSYSRPMKAPPPSVMLPAGSFQNKRRINVYGTTLLAKSILRMSDIGVLGKMMLAPPAETFCVKPTSAGPSGEKHERHGVARIFMQTE